jgi:hypothetical protein
MIDETCCRLTNDEPIHLQRSSTDSSTQTRSAERQRTGKRLFEVVWTSGK